MLILSDDLVKQPFGAAKLKPEFESLFTSLTVPGDLLSTGFDVFRYKTAPFTSNGGASIRGLTPHGQSLKGDGVSSVTWRSVSVYPQPMWMIASFIPTVVTTTQKSEYALGSASAGTSAYFSISSGLSASNISCAFRGADGGGSIIKLGPVPELGKSTTVVFVCPNNLIADARVYVNGLEYNTNGAGGLNTTFTTSLAYEAISALKRGTVTSYSPDHILLAGYGLGQIPPNMAKSLSNNPWQIFQPVQQVFYFNTTSGSGGTAALTGGSILIFTSSIVSSSDKELAPSINTIEQGVLKSLTDKPLLGDSSSFFNSTLTSSINKILSGTGLVSSVGNISVFTVGDTTLPLSGSAIVSALENLISARNLSIAGAGLSSSIGTLVSDRNVTVLSSLLQSSSSTLNSSVSKSIAGLLLSSSLGTLQLEDGSVILPLTGISGTLSQDSLLPLFTKGLSGSSLILSSEQLRALVSKVLPGQSTVIAQGDTGVVITRSLTGSVTVSGQGSVLFADSNATLSLSGSSIITSQGVLAILGDIEPVITKVVVQGISYTLLTFNTLNKIIT